MNNKMLPGSEYNLPRQFPTNKTVSELLTKSPHLLQTHFPYFLSITLKNNDTNLLSFLLNAKPSPVQSNREELYSFFLQCIDARKVSMVKVLLGKGIDPNILNEEGETPLHIAASKGDIEMVKLLLAYQANGNIYTKEHLSAYDYALEQGDSKVIEMLKQQKSYSMVIQGSLPTQDDSGVWTERKVMNNHRYEKYDSYRPSKNNKKMVVIKQHKFLTAHNERRNVNMLKKAFRDVNCDYFNESSFIGKDCIVIKSAKNDIEEIEKEYGCNKEKDKSFNTVKAISLLNKTDQETMINIKETDSTEYNPNHPYPNKQPQKQRLKHKEKRRNHRNNNNGIKSRYSNGNGQGHYPSYTQSKDSVTYTYTYTKDGEEDIVQQRLPIPYSIPINNLNILNELAINNQSNQSDRSPFYTHHDQSFQHIQISQKDMKDIRNTFPTQSIALSTSLRSQSLQVIQQEVYLFLSEINMAEYTQLMIKNGFDDINLIIDQTKLSIAITDQNLRDAGMRLPGDRAKILVRFEEKAKLFDMELNKENVYYRPDSFNMNKSDRHIQNLYRFLLSIKLEGYLDNFLSAGYASIELIMMQMITRQPITDDVLMNEIGIEKIGYRARLLNKFREDAKNYMSKIKNGTILIDSQKNEGEFCNCLIY